MDFHSIPEDVAITTSHTDGSVVLDLVRRLRPLGLNPVILYPSAEAPFFRLTTSVPVRMLLDFIRARYPHIPSATG